MPKAKTKHPGLLDSWGRRNNRRLQDSSCAHCQKLFKPTATIQIYCSKKCGWLGNASERKIRERFFAQVKKTGGCWIWIGSRNTAGYGMMRAFKRQRWLAHRLSWILHGGLIPKGKWVLHRCDNPPCVNPDHLWLGDHNTNTSDKINKQRQSRGEQCKKALTVAHVEHILSLHKMGQGYGTIAKSFPCTKENIASIIKGKTWKHVPR